MSNNELLLGRQLRSGTWTKEEERYASALMEAFVSGLLDDCPDNTSLRSYLAIKLGCSAKRISKKYEGTDYPGKRKYVDKDSPETEEVESTRLKLREYKESYEESVRVLYSLKERNAKAAGRQTFSGSEAQRKPAAIDPLLLDAANRRPSHNVDASRQSDLQSINLLGSSAIHSQHEVRDAFSMFSSGATASTRAANIDRPVMQSSPLPSLHEATTRLHALSAGPNRQEIAAQITQRQRSILDRYQLQSQLMSDLLWKRQRNSLLADQRRNLLENQGLLNLLSERDGYIEGTLARATNMAPTAHFSPRGDIGALAASLFEESTRQGLPPRANHMSGRPELTQNHSTMRLSESFMQTSALGRSASLPIEAANLSQPRPGSSEEKSSVAGTIERFGGATEVSPPETRTCGLLAGSTKRPIMQAEDHALSQLQKRKRHGTN